MAASTNRHGISLVARAPHLVAGAAALMVVILATAGADVYASRLEQRYIHAIAPLQFNQKNRGVAFQRAALREPELLPLYGSSELEHLSNPYHATNFFHEYPTGFTVFPVGDVGATTLIMVESLASLGADARGKQIAFSLSPYWFYQINDYAEEYAGNFSELQALSTILDGHLSLDLRARIARRMLAYPAVFKGRPVLEFAVAQLAQDSPRRRAAFYAVTPLARAAMLVLRLQDHWESVSYMRHESLDPSPARRRATVDWPDVLRDSKHAYETHNTSNQFGFDDHWYTKRGKKGLGKYQTSDDDLWKGLNESAEWTDLELLLTVARELGVSPMILCAPSAGLFYDYLKLSDAPRRAYYDKFDRTVKSFGVPVFSFQDHDRDSAFVEDPGAHPSEYGWAHYDQALDAFYQGRERASATE